MIKDTIYVAMIVLFFWLGVQWGSQRETMSVNLHIKALKAQIVSSEQKNAGHMKIIENHRDEMKARGLM